MQTRDPKSPIGFTTTGIVQTAGGQGAVAKACGVPVSTTLHELFA